MINKQDGKIRYFLLGAVLLAGAGGWYVLGREDNAAPQDEALLATVEIGSIENTIAAAGSLKPSNYVDVGAQVSGQLQRLFVEIGDFVEEGQLLAEIDARVQEARVSASRASIESLEVQLDARQAALELARSNVARQTQLAATDVTSQFELDTALNSVASAEASLFQLEKQIEQNKASLDSEETLLEFTRIYAPIAGTVVAIEMEEGRTLNAVQMAPTILRIADLNTMTVEASISEADIGDVRAGMDVYFTTLGGRQRRWYSQVKQILPTPVIENNVVLYTGLFDIENNDSALLPEMTAQVYFITASAQDVLTVPMGALRFLDRPGRPGRPGGAAGGGTPDPKAIQRRRRELAGALPAGDGLATGQTAGADAAAPRFREGREGRARRGRPAMVTVVNDDGSQQEVEIRVGVNSRISAEVIEGLQAGDKVVAGIIQGQRPNNQQDARRRSFRPPF
jgi:macrolide-specific efflux system membrane fusion protein